jgi:Domain of unknown function (DUF222)/HNH endonuclease
MCAPGQQPAAPSSARQAVAALQAALACLAATDPTVLTVAEQADCLRGLQRAESIRVAAQSSVLAAFQTNCGFADDGHGSARSWLRWQTRITGPAASAAVAWTRRLAAHLAIREALAAGEVSESWGRQICEWTDLLPPSARGDADTILLAAAAAGASLLDLAGLAEEMRARTATPDSDGDGLPDRSLRLDLHYRGAGRLRGDLTPRCAAAIQAVLDALGKKQGPEDLRTRTQRDHDALEEACHRLIAAGMLPDRAGQPTQIQLHMNLGELPGRAGRSGPCEPATGESARRRLFPDRDDLTGPWQGGYPGPGPMARPGDLCDSSMVPVVSGQVDHELLGRLAAALVSGDPAALAAQPDPTSTDTAGDGTILADRYARELILRGALALLSGPEGLASRLRTGTLTGPAASVSLPLDVGAATEVIPPHLRRAVTLRDVHCGFPGCDNRHCQVHHLVPRSEGGSTRLDNLGLFCLFHHLIVIHEWGWRVILNADGTKTAISPDGRRVLHSHGPPHAA